LAMAPSAACLGIAIGERAIALAEVATAHRTRSVVRSAVLRLSEPLSVSDPKTVGEKLRLFLQEQKFTARRAVIGLPARSLVAVEKKLPPANEATAAEILRLAAERQFPPEHKVMEFDYAGKADSQQPQSVLLVAGAKQNLDRLMEMLEAAELKAVGVTSSTLVLSSMLNGADRPDILLAIAEESAEVVVVSQNGPRQLRHLPVSGQQLISSNGTAAASLASLGGELFRTASLGAAADAGASKLLIWDDVGLDPGVGVTIGQRSGLNVTTLRDLSRLAVSPPAAAVGDQPASAAAVALAVAGTRGDVLPINFLRSRLAPVKKSRVNPKVMWGSIVGGIVVLGLLAMWWDVHRLQSTYDDNTEWLRVQAAKIKEAQDNVTKANFAYGWFNDGKSDGGRTPVLDCLRYITEKFPQDPSIWATNFTLHDNGKAVLGGRAVDKSEVYRLYDRILADKRFTDVTLPDFHDAGGSSRDYIFSLSLTYRGEAAKQP